MIAAGDHLLVFMPARRDWPGAGRTAPGPATGVGYVLFQEGGVARAGNATLARLPSARSTDIVFDALDVYTGTVQAPRIGESKLRLALPHLLEERLLSDVADCHFAWIAAPDRAPSADGLTTLRVAVIERATLARTLEAFEQVQRPVQAAYSALYTLREPGEGVFALRVGDGRGLLRTGSDSGLAFDLGEDATSVLGVAKRSAGIVRLAASGELPDSLVDAAHALGIEVDRDAGAVDAAGIGGAVDLLQGPFAVSSRYGLPGQLLLRMTREGSWRTPAAWVLACTLISVVGLNATWWKLSSQYRDLRGTMLQTFRDAFPEERTVVDELAQARRTVAGLRTRAGRPSAGDFSVLNAQAVQVFADAPTGIVTLVEYQGGTYNVHCKPEALENPALRNALQARALAQRVELRFAPDGVVQIAPFGG